MKAMVFAAGLGSRLGYVTKNIPKALVEINGKPMIERVILKLKSYGVSNIIINLHHYPEQIKTFIRSNNNFGLNISFSEETGQLLETGGGLIKASWFFKKNEPFFIHNVDVLSDVDLNEMLQFHHKHNPLTTLFVQQRNSSRYFLFDDQSQLKGWTNTKTGEVIKVDNSKSELSQLAFNGIHIINPEIFSLMDKTGTFSITQSYLDLAGKYAINGFCSDHANYIDIGKPKIHPEAEELAMMMDASSG